MVHREKSGLGQLDYLFGVMVPDCWNWKLITFALHSRCEVSEVQFSCNVKSSNLRLSVRHNFVE